MKLKNNIITTLAFAGVASSALSAEISDADLAALKQQLADLDQKVRVLERERDIDTDNAAAKAKAEPVVSIGENGVNFNSSDSNFVAQLHAVVQFDSRSFFHGANANGNSGFLLRRARPIFSGTVYHDFDYNFTPDFGGSTVQILDAYVNYHPLPGFQIQGGKFKAPIGLEHLVADRDLLFNERSLATDLVPNRDIGIEAKGDLFGGAASYAVGLFNGDTDYNSTTVNTPFQDDKSIDGRLFFQPWKNTDVHPLRGLGFGLGGSYLVSHPATNSATGLTPGYTTDGQQKFFAYNTGVNASGPAWRLAPQAYYYYGPLGILAEYTIDEQQAQRTANPIIPAVKLQNSAWEVTGSWVLTGEDATYGSLTPRHPFDLRTGGWGAWQLVARYAGLNVDDNAFAGATAIRLADPTKNAAAAQGWSVGLNWYLNKNVRADLSYSRTTFSSFAGNKIAAGNPGAQPENVLFSRLQLAF
jgi:phosphate-selective porin OprO/OprP